MNSRIWKFWTKIWISWFSIRLHRLYWQLSLLVSTMAWTEDIIQCLSPHLLQKYHTCKTQCKTYRRNIQGPLTYTRQNKLRVIPRSKQCNSIFSKLPGLISISDCYNNLTDDTLGLDEQFPVKIFFSKSLIFEISKIFIFNPKSLNFYFLWLINHFSIRLVKRALINSFFHDYKYNFL